MSFYQRYMMQITLETLSPLLHESVVQVCREQAVFATLTAQAGAIATQESGADPGSVTAQSRYLGPIASIITKLAQSQIGTVSPERGAQIQADYDDAIRRLHALRNGGLASGVFRSGQMQEGL